MSGPITAFLVAVRRRLRRTWVIATLQWLAPIAALASLALVLIGRRVPEAWPEPAALVVVAAVVVSVLLVGILLRIPDSTVARAADRQLATKDALATALEVPADTDWGDRVQRRAATLVAGVPAKVAAPIRLSARRIATSGVLGLVAVVLAVAPNHQDDVRRRARGRTGRGRRCRGRAPRGSRRPRGGPGGHRRRSRRGRGAPRAG